jgi:hypothetical protein
LAIKAIVSIAISQSKTYINKQQIRMNTKNKIYPYRVNNGAYEQMLRILKYPLQVDRRMDGQLCRITVTDYTIEANIKKEYQRELIKDRIWQVEVHGIQDKDFLVLNSLLTSLGGDVLVVDENGKVLFGGELI